MHFENASIPHEYYNYINKKILFIFSLVLTLTLLFIISLSFGSIEIDLFEVIKTLLTFGEDKRVELILLNIRLPQALTAVVAGSGIATSGAVMQSVLRNPLASPFTLGISHASAFGAALAVILSGTVFVNSEIFNLSNPLLTISASFFFSIVTSTIIIFIAKNKGASPQVMVLTGIALGSLFGAGTMLIQYFADDVQLAAMIFWTFGDTARTNWNELQILSVLTIVSQFFFIVNSRYYNAMIMGDETAKGLGVKVETVRLTGMAIASLLTSVTISFVGIISFVGLVAPHIVRRLIGDDHRFLIPAVMLAGGLILLCADIVARLIFLPHVLPVSIFTAFLGAPVFIYLIIKGSRQ
ncbi:MAG: iron ABC transporter permease [Desulfobacterales bacterium]|nr:iron ABC transporter permease [Desulfobacterales bacterium]MCP4162237.1 iron ABC transporter permease [Deltaproteobacteria bacterium]